MRSSDRISRQLRLVTLLAQSARGLPSTRLAASLGCSRPTVDRDLDLLRKRVGLPIERVRVNGEVWHRWGGVPLRLAITPVQLAALALAREALAPLAGMALVRELDALVPSSPHRTPIRLAPARGSREAILGAIDDAIQSGHRVRIEVRVASRGGKRERYVIEPITVRVAAGEPYVDAWSVAKNALRTFKLARIERALVLDERAAPHSDVDLDEVFAHAVKTWSGDVTRVRIRIAADVAWAVPEYPLAPSQSILREPDGSVIVEADVAGLVEASRWALGWGRHAEALEPSALRERVRAELSGALARYDAHEVRSRIVSEPAPATPAAPPRRRPRSTARTTQVRGSK